VTDFTLTKISLSEIGHAFVSYFTLLKLKQGRNCRKDIKNSLSTEKLEAG